MPPGPGTGVVPSIALRISSVGTAFPPHYYEQDELLSALKRYWAREHHNPSRLDRLHENVLVGGRHLALPLPAYEELDGFGDANDAWLQVAQEVGAAAVTDALERSGLGPEDVDHLFTVTVTGIATPSLDARLVNRLGLRPDVRRTPIFGLGCVAGAAVALARRLGDRLEVVEPGDPSPGGCRAWDAGARRLAESRKTRTRLDQECVTVPVVTPFEF